MNDTVRRHVIVDVAEDAALITYRSRDAMHEVVHAHRVKFFLQREGLEYVRDDEVRVGPPRSFLGSLEGGRLDVDQGRRVVCGIWLLWR